jgi:hypothetical protein
MVMAAIMVDLWALRCEEYPHRSGASLHQIADALNARGINAAFGGRWVR